MGSVKAQLVYTMGWLSCNRTSKLLISRITLQGDDFCRLEIFKNWNQLFHLLDCTVIKAGSAHDTSTLASADFDRDLLMLHLLWNLHQKPGYHHEWCRCPSSPLGCGSISAKTPLELYKAQREGKANNGELKVVRHELSSLRHHPRAHS